MIGLIGAGNMARSLAGGLLASGWPRDRLILSDPDDGQRAAVERHLKIAVDRDNRQVARQADILVFAIKPQVFGPAARELAVEVQRRRPLVVSLAAGVRIADLERWLGGNLPVVRVMPNTPALVGSGASGLFANDRVTNEQRDRAEAIARAVGVTVWVSSEAQLDVVTALSGSGPAYFFWSWRRSKKPPSPAACRANRRGCWHWKPLSAPPRWRLRVPMNRNGCAGR